MPDLPHFGPGVPASSRVCSYLSGGFDWYEADAELAEEITRICPEAPGMARSSREFLRRAVR
jgi:hypothetical protein